MRDGLKGVRYKQEMHLLLREYLVVICVGCFHKMAPFLSIPSSLMSAIYNIWKISLEIIFLVIWNDFLFVWKMKFWPLCNNWRSAELPTFTFRRFSYTIIDNGLASCETVPHYI